MRMMMLKSTAAAVLAAMVVGAGCGRGGESKGPKPSTDVVVTLRAATTRPVQRWIGAVGTLYGNEEATISAKVAGRIVASYHDVGDRAAAGEILAQIEKIDYELACKQKELALRSSLSKLGLTAMPGPGFDVSKTPTVERARLQSTNAEERFKRAKSLFEAKPQPMIPEQDYQDIKTTWDVARSNYDVELLAAQSLIVDAQAKQVDLDVATQKLKDTAAIAPEPQATTRPATQPASYAVAAKQVSVGEYVREGAPLFRLIDDDTIKLRAALPERYISQIRQGQAVKVNIEAYPKDFFGQITRINPQVDVANRTFQIEVAVANGQHLLKSGSFARAQVLVREDPAAVFVPQESLVTFAGNTTLFTVKDNQAVAIPEVDLGERWENPQTKEQWVEITKGLKGNELVVVTGGSKLTDGAAVKVKTEAELSGTRPTTRARPADASSRPADGPSAEVAK